VPHEWNVHSRQKLEFAVTAYDCKGRTLRIDASKLPSDASMVQGYDSTLGKQKGVIRWTPGADDVGKRNLWSFVAVASDPKGVKTSHSQKTLVSVLPPDPTDSPDPAADAAIAGVATSRAIWHANTHRLELAGKILWNRGTSKGVRSEAIVSAVKILDTQTSAEITETSANASGKWFAIITLPSDVTPPNMVEAEFHGKNSLPKSVSHTR
jgi:hypothetical protein